jgi:hypothetical protein
MTKSVRPQDVEERFRKLMRDGGLLEPEEVAQLRRAVVFVWYDPKLVVVVDLEELAEDGDPSLALSAHGRYAGIRAPNDREDSR